MLIRTFPFLIGVEIREIVPSFHFMHARKVRILHLDNPAPELTSNWWEWLSSACSLHSSLAPFGILSARFLADCARARLAETNYHEFIIERILLSDIFWLISWFIRISKGKVSKVLQILISWTITNDALAKTRADKSYNISNCRKCSSFIRQTDGAKPQDK